MEMLVVIVTITLSLTDVSESNVTSLYTSHFLLFVLHVPPTTDTKIHSHVHVEAPAPHTPATSLHQSGPREAPGMQTRLCPGAQNRLHVRTGHIQAAQINTELAPDIAKFSDMPICLADCTPSPLNPQAGRSPIIGCHVCLFNTDRLSTSVLRGTKSIRSAMSFSHWTNSLPLRTEGSLPCSQYPATSPCFGSEGPSPPTPTMPLQDPFQYYYGVIRGRLPRIFGQTRCKKVTNF
jgi:hypothetical protein